jgi:hypothetical protein
MSLHSDRREWPRVMDKLSGGGVLYVRWLNRISRRYDELNPGYVRVDAHGSEGYLYSERSAL